MKTPIQELIEIIKKRQEDDEAMPFMYNDRIIVLAESMLEKEKEQMAYNSVRAIVEFQNNKNVELIEHPTELGSYHLRGEKEELDKVLYGETFNTKKR